MEKNIKVRYFTSYELEKKWKYEKQWYPITEKGRRLSDYAVTVEWGCPVAGNPARKSHRCHWAMKPVWMAMPDRGKILFTKRWNFMVTTWNLPSSILYFSYSGVETMAHLRCQAQCWDKCWGHILAQGKHAVTDWQRLQLEQWWVKWHQVIRLFYDLDIN